MTNERAIEILRGEIMCRYSGDSCDVDCSNCPLVAPTPTHEIVEAYVMAIRELSKDINKEPIQPHIKYIGGEEHHDFFCPTCGEFLAPESHGLEYKRVGYFGICPSCGQSIIWKKENR